MNELETKSAGVPAYIGQTDGPTGYEDMGEGWFKNQYLSIAQSQSAKTMKASSDYIQGLEPGMFFSPSTKKVIGNSARIILLGAWDSVTEKDGKGQEAKFVARLTMAEFQALGLGRDDRDGKYWVDKEKGHYYDQQKNFFVLLADEPEAGTYIYSVPGSGFRAVRSWITASANVRENVGGKIYKAKMFERIWELSSIFVEDKEHNSSYFTLGDAKDRGWIAEDIHASVKEAFNAAQDVIRSNLGAVEVEAGEVDKVPF